MKLKIPTIRRILLVLSFCAGFTVASLLNSESLKDVVHIGEKDTIYVELNKFTAAELDSIAENFIRPESDIENGEITQYEGFRDKPYFCPSGYLTIGYGRNLESNGITKEEAKFLLKNDLKQAEADLIIVFGSNLYYGLSKARRTVLINMMMNMGIGNFLEFKNFINLIKKKNFKKAADEMKRSSWYKQVKRRAERMITIMKTDKYLESTVNGKEYKRFYKVRR
jgi:lysozyme